MISPFASASTLPFSRVMSRARSSARSVSSSQERRSTSARCRGAVAAQPGWASAAAAAAARASSAPALATLAMTSSVPGSMHVEALAARGGAPLATDEQVGAGCVVSHRPLFYRGDGPDRLRDPGPRRPTVASTRIGQGQGGEHEPGVPEARARGGPRHATDPSTSTPSRPVASHRSIGSVSAANRAASASSGDEQPADHEGDQHDEGEEPGVAPSSPVSRRRLAACSASGGRVEQLLAADRGADDDGAGHRHAAGLQRQHPAADRGPAGPERRQHDQRRQHDAGGDGRDGRPPPRCAVPTRRWWARREPAVGAAAQRQRATTSERERVGVTSRPRRCPPGRGGGSAR